MATNRVPVDRPTHVRAGLAFVDCAFFPCYLGPPFSYTCPRSKGSQQTLEEILGRAWQCSYMEPSALLACVVSPLRSSRSSAAIVVYVTLMSAAACKRKRTGILLLLDGGKWDLLVYDLEELWSDFPMLQEGLRWQGVSYRAYCSPCVPERERDKKRASQVLSMSRPHIQTVT